MAAIPTAAVLLIGNELLSGKIRDENGWFLAGVLRRRGIDLVEVAIVPDEPQVIASTAVRLLARAEIVFTSGGVGPTHDDVTIASLAKALERPVERHAGMQKTLREYYGDKANEAALSMADVVQGTVLRADRGWPVMRVDVAAGSPVYERPEGLLRPSRLYVLPGIPSLLRAKVRALEDIDGELPQTQAWNLVRLDVAGDESQLSAPLSTVVEAFPEVAIGSYPRFLAHDDGTRSVRVQLTFEAHGAHRDQARKAAQAFAEAIGDLEVEWLDGP